MAGEPGDRWSRLRSGGLKAAATRPRREESPDTVLRHVDRSAFIMSARGQRWSAGLKPGATQARRADAHGERRAVNGTQDMGNAPGNARGRG